MTYPRHPVELSEEASAEIQRMLDRIEELEGQVEALSEQLRKFGHTPEVT